MTKDVLVTVSGKQFDLDDEAIELVVPGTYYFKNGKHYVFYEERVDETDPVTNNCVKFYDGYFEMVKKGGQTSFLMFELDKKTSTVYETPAGPMRIDSMTHELTIEESEDEILVTVGYTLDLNYNFVSDCQVTVKIQSR